MAGPPRRRSRPHRPGLHGPPPGCRDRPVRQRAGGAPLGAGVATPGLVGHATARCACDVLRFSWDGGARRWAASAREALERRGGRGPRDLHGLPADVCGGGGDGRHRDRGRVRRGRAGHCVGPAAGRASWAASPSSAPRAWRRSTRSPRARPSSSGWAAASRACCRARPPRTRRCSRRCGWGARPSAWGWRRSSTSSIRRSWRWGAGRWSCRAISTPPWSRPRATACRSCGRRARYAACAKAS